MKIKLKEIRQSKGINQTQVAKNLNITQASYSHYENGRNQPTYELLIKLADFYKVSVDELLGHKMPYLIDKSLLSEKQLNLINLIQKLNDYQCDKVEAFIMGISLAEIERQQTIEKFKNRGK